MSGNTTHSPEDVTRYLLVGGSLGTLPANSGLWPIYAGYEPDTPDNCITIYGTENVLDARDMTSGQVIEHYGIQVRVRAIDYETGRAKCVAIATYLDETVLRTSVTIGANSYEVQCYNRRSPILSLGRENPTSKRELFTVNYTTDLRQTA